MRPAYQTSETIGQFLARLLDRGAATSVLNRILVAVAAQGDAANLQRALDALVADFQARGERALRPRSAAWRGLLGELNAMTARQAAALRSGAPYIMAASQRAAAESVPALALWGASRAQGAGVRAAWNTPDPEAVQALIERTQLPAFEQALSRFGDGVADAVRAVLLRGLVTGGGPLALARELRGVIADVPRHQAATLARTLQLTAYRDATAVHQAANGHLIERVIRIAALDDRTCLSCIALHGTEIPIGSRVDDHWNGRCVAVSQVRGRPLAVQTGEDWLRGLPAERQQAIMGPAKFAAWQAGAVQLSEFVHRVTDPVFGNMVQEASLRGLLGEARSRQYIQMGREARR